MKKILLFSILFIGFAFASIGQTWDGSVSSNWNTAANWTPANVPNANNEDAVINGAGTFQPVLTSIISIRDLTISGGSLGLAGFTLTIGDDGFFTGGTVSNGTINAVDFSAMANTTFSGTISLVKTAGGDNDLAGGNTFNGPTTITHNDNSRLRFANTNGDTFNSTLILNKINSGNFELAHRGTNSINSISINNSNIGGQMNFGVGGGTSTLVTGGLATSGFTGTLVINNLTQVMNVANSPFTLVAFTVANSRFLGNFQVTSTGAINFNGNNIFAGNNSFISGGQINMTAGGNTFSNPGNATTITRNGGGGITWGAGNTFSGLTLTDNSAGGPITMVGGNIFNGNTLVTNNSNTNLQFANTTGDTFNGPVTFQNNNASFMDIARRGTNIFAQQITINNTNAAGEVRFGEFGGTSVLQTGGLVTTGFAACNILEINNFTQLTNAPNGTFTTTTFTSANSSFLGNFNVNTINNGDITFTGSNRYDGTNNFNSNDRIIMSGANFFSTVPGNNSLFTKGPGSVADDSWAGGNTFGDVQIINNSTNRTLRLANVNGDTFLGTSVFDHNSTNIFDIAYNGNSTFAQQITINNNAAGTMRFGGSTTQNGTSLLSSGALTTTNFNTGVLNVRRFTQTNPVANSTFNPATFESQNSSFQGNFTVSATTVTFLNANTFASNNSFISSGQMNMATGGNLFSNPGNTTILTRNGGGNVTWGPGNTFGTLTLTDNSTGNLLMQGGNTFGPATIINNSNDLLRLANSQGDTFAGISTFINNGTNTFEIARIGTNTFGDNITINNLNAGGTMNFGSNGGTSTLTNGGLLTSNYSVGSTLTVNNFSQVSSVPNGNFSMNTFSASGSTLRGNIGITTLSGAITLQNSSTFAGNDTFNSAGLISILNNNSFPGNDTFTAATSIEISNTNSFPGNDTFTAATSIGISNNNTFSGNNSFVAGTTLLVAGNNNIGGNNTFTTGTGGITIDTNNTFPENNTFTAATGIQLTNGGNTFSTNAGTTTTMIKNGSTTNDWQGGNTFGDFDLINNGTGRIRLASPAVGVGDNFIGDVNFIKNSTGAIEPAYNNVSTFAGDISTVGSNTVLTFGIGTGTVEINGNTAQNLLTNGTLIPLFRRVRMNGTGTFELADPVTILISLDLQNGIINNNENLLTLPSGSFVTGGSNASHVNGRIRKIGLLTPFSFPFGNDGFYAPLTLTTPLGNATDQFRGRYFHNDPDPLYDRDSKEATIGLVNECEYWELERLTGSTVPTLEMSWSSDRTCPIDDFNEFMVTKWDGSQWTDLGQSNLSGNATSGTVRNQTATPNFSPGIFTLSQSFRILPIELLSFTAIITEEDKIKVSWSTAMEKNNSFFTLEKSNDGINWSPIGLIPGAGDSDIILFYDFIDESPVFGRQYYRLTQTDFDGTSETFKVVGVTMQTTNEKIEYKVYPNPSSGIVKILSQNTNMEEAEIMVLNSQGQIVRTVKGISGRLVEMDLSSLPKGLYILKIKNNYHYETKKVVIN